MRIFEDENYYQILHVPVDADAGEIKRAYRESLSLYEDKSVVTYALFSDDQRENLLQTIETAFATLSDETTRAAYNQMLIESGQVKPDSFSKQDQRILGVGSATGTESKEKSLEQWIGKRVNKPKVKQLIEEIHANALASGPHFKQLRESYDVEIAEINAVTKISRDILNMIEGDQFQDLPAETYLKQFLRTYAEILHVDPQHVVDSYLRCMALDKKER